MRFAIDAIEVEAEAKAMLRATIEASGWYPDLKPQEREARIEQDVDTNWRLMADEARRRLEEREG